MKTLINQKNQVNPTDQIFILCLAFEVVSWFNKKEELEDEITILKISLWLGFLIVLVVNILLKP